MTASGSSWRSLREIIGTVLDQIEPVPVKTEKAASAGRVEAR